MYVSGISSLVSYFAALTAGSAIVKRQASSTTSAVIAVSTDIPDGGDDACTYDSESRWCWGDGYTIAADFDKKWPTTGRTVTYNWDITNTTKDIDGTGGRMVFLVDGQYPGPTIRANWGDKIEVTINNKLDHNGTGIHWHGLRQFNTVEQDGVPGITECPIAPQSSRTYHLTATQYGTSWYHSHWSVQYGQGVLGPIIVEGPSSGNYDEDLGTLPITDWYDITAFQGMYRARSLPPQASNGLINGTMVSPDGNKGKYANTTISHGKRYRIRIINTSVDSHFHVSLDGHPFTVISNDFVPIKPYATKWLSIAIGQRYDVVIEANQTASNYWFRAEVPSSGACGNNANNGNIKSIFHYSNATNENPTSKAFDGLPSGCDDESPSNLQPYWDSFVPSEPLSALPTVLNVSNEKTGVILNPDNTTNATLFRWGIDFSSINVTWEKPTLEYVKNDDLDFPAEFNVIDMPKNTDWTYWVLQEVNSTTGFSIKAPHPIHLHGHDFFLLGTGSGVFSLDKVGQLNFDNPVRRDTAILPQDGWMVMAFQADNPGAWIMHCHIAWHVSDGLAAQFLESPDKIAPLSAEFGDTCAAWDNYWPTAVYPKDDSGV